MKILKNVLASNILFLDIETVNLVEKLEVGTDLYKSWEYKNKHSRDKVALPDQDEEKFLVDLYDKTAGLYPEFAKVCCISIGMVKNGALQVKSYYGENELEILTTFANVADKLLSSNKNIILSGFALKGFDIPFLVRRMVINDIDIPNLIDFGGLKPWEINILDTLELWRGSAFANASLINVTTAMGLKSPKDDIFGYQVRDTYYNKEVNRLDRIARYCEKDVLASCQILLKMMREPLVNMAEEQVETEVRTPLLERLFNGGKYGLKDAKQLIAVYKDLSDYDKERMQLVLKSLISKNTHFTEKHLEAIINYKK